MQYLAASKGAAVHLPDGCRVLAAGETISFELPWAFAPLLARLDDSVDLPALKADLSEAGYEGFAVEGLEEPGHGQAFVLGAHIVHDPVGFRPYAADIPDIVKSFGGRFIARAGKVTPLSGAFVPERVVVIEFPTADDALRFYTSERYAPLLKIRLATTEARFMIMARSGELPAGVRAAAKAYLQRSA
ncbi:DUF1330 domain-containing protein [Rhodoplanes sp. Z2-YC6860]|uniref:DUF1330 domain-containing protein n=1 Tax=Rhodoplanes sp. Z2-YC6860 TaxID=674703 RepID=UPI00078EF0C1|nr:DUF1330 domain-containing protein [Rhodoplanes sp. Z2-YC6860]AMN40797.1 hypothetical protein RHPLAN_23570 [Rhodoplanes sp. Z2-YC6860]